MVDVPGCGLIAASIDWGDGAPSSAGASDGATGVQGTHTYAEEGVYRATVSYTCTQFRGTQTAQFQATVHDAPVTVGGRNVSGTAGQPLTAVVAHIDDTNPAAADFSAQVTWGDGTAATPGSVAAAAGGGFDVTSAHAYIAAGNHPVITTVSDTGGITTTTTANARIAPAPQPILLPPLARFTSSPGLPCSGESVAFDASGSGGGSFPITRYQWTFTGVKQKRPTITYARTTSALRVGFGSFRARTVSARDTFFPGTTDIRTEDAVLEFFRPPVGVHLTVVDSMGDTASADAVISFANPDETLELLTEIGQPNRQLSPRTPCQRRAAFQQVVVSQVAVLKGTSILARIPCLVAPQDCIGVLAVRSARTRGAARHVSSRRPDPSMLGQTAFAVPAGQTSTVIVRLNARGRLLARAHRLRRVVLALGSLGAKGSFVTKTRVVRLRARG